MPNSVVLRIRRSEVQPGDIILGPAPSRDLPLARRPRYNRRVSSLDRNDFRRPQRGGGELQRWDDSGRDPYDSEGSIPPQRGRGVVSRRGQQFQDPYDSEGSIPPRSRRKAGKEASKRNGSSSSESSSDLGCTDDDEKEKHKAKLKKWGAIGLAGVATIHAVHGVHEGIEKAKKRNEELAEGEISEEEAKKRKKSARWRNAANVGIAAVWIKGAYDEIKEYREAQREHAEIIEKAEERHKKRMERQKAMRNGGFSRQDG